MSTQARDVARGGPEPLGVWCDLDVTPIGEVRRLVRDALAGQDGIVVDDAVLVTDELVSNAHQHARSPRTCRIAVVDDGRRLRVEVDDASFAQPRIRTPDHTGGRGLLLVDRLASAWGVENYAEHKTVWAEMVLDGAGSHARHLAVARKPRA